MDKTREEFERLYDCEVRPDYSFDAMQRLVKTSSSKFVAEFICNLVASLNDYKSGSVKKASEWVSVEDESLLPDFDVNVQVWVGEYGIERQASARRTKTNNHGDWGWYESNITNTMLTMVTHHKPTVNPKGPSE